MGKRVGEGEWLVSDKTQMRTGLWLENQRPFLETDHLVIVKGKVNKVPHQVWEEEGRQWFD
jgi:hypothetical protein